MADGPEGTQVEAPPISPVATDQPGAKAPVASPSPPSAETPPVATEGAKPPTTLITGDKPPEPIAYEEFKLPEGVELAPEAVTAYKDVLATLDVDKATGQVTQKGAQQLVDFYTDLAKQAADQSYQAFQEMVDGWGEEVKADKELGGANLANVKRLVGAAFDKYGSAEAKEAFDYTGAGNNPAIVRMIYRMAKVANEGAAHVQGGPAGAKPSLAEAMFPSMKQG